MKGLLKDTVLYAFSLFLATYIFNGVTIYGGINNYIIGGFALTLLLLLVKPILTIITFPINVITLGLFSLFTNVIILYLLTVFVPSIEISSFTINSFTAFGVIIPTIVLNRFFAYCIVAAFISMLTGFINWLVD